MKLNNQTEIFLYLLEQGWSAEIPANYSERFIFADLVPQQLDVLFEYDRVTAINIRPSKWREDCYTIKNITDISEKLRVCEETKKIAQYIIERYKK